MLRIYTVDGTSIEVPGTLNDQAAIHSALRRDGYYALIQGPNRIFVYAPAVAKIEHTPNESED